MGEGRVLNALQIRKKVVLELIIIIFFIFVFSLTFFLFLPFLAFLSFSNLFCHTGLPSHSVCSNTLSVILLQLSSLCS